MAPSQSVGDYEEVLSWLKRTPLYRLTWWCLLIVQAVLSPFDKPRADPLSDEFWLERQPLETDLENKTHRVCVSKWLPAFRKSQLSNFLPALPLAQNASNLYRLDVENRPFHSVEMLKKTSSRLVVIVGPPRVGSTFLHTLLALDAKQTRTLKAWELRHPFAESFETSTKTKRMELCERELSTLYSLAPRMTAIHHVEFDGPDECVVGMHTSPLIDVCAWGCLKLDEAYEFWLSEKSDCVYERYFELISTLIATDDDDDGEKTMFSQLVLKSPHHSLKLKGMLDRSPFKSFSHKKLLWLHRDPVDVVCSTCEMNCAMLDYSSAYFFHRHDLGIRTLDRLWRAVRALAEAEAEGREFVHVSYSALVSDPSTTVQKVYEQAGMKAGKDFFSEILPTFLDESAARRKKLGSRRESGVPKEDVLKTYGLSKSKVNETFSEYVAKYSQYF